MARPLQVGVIATLAWLAPGAAVEAAGLKAAEPAAPHELLAYIGVPDELQAHGGYLRFRLWNSELRFMVPDVPMTAPIVARIRAAAAAERSMSVRFTAESGRFSPPDSIAAFQALGFTIDGVSAAVPDLPDTRSDAIPTEQQAALLRGLALSWAGDHNRALSALAQASHPALEQLSPGQQLLLYRVRGRTLENRARDADQWPSAAADRDLVLALQDHLVWAERQPDDMDAWYAVARTLRDLGAYDDALRVYAHVRERWPGEALWVAIRRGGVLRDRGDPAGALQQLDALAIDIGPQPGMAFHFNRGYALLMLQRHREAVAEFSTGLANQSDYPWAYVYRACAHAGAGELEPALQDLARGRTILAGEPANTRGDRFNLARIDAMRAELADAHARQPAQPLPQLCDRFWHVQAGPRARATGVPAVSIPVRALAPGAARQPAPRSYRWWWMVMLMAAGIVLAAWRVRRS